MNKKVVEYGKKVIGKLAKTIAVKDANTTCPFLGYQPDLPDSVKKLGKTKHRKCNSRIIFGKHQRLLLEG